MSKIDYNSRLILDDGMPLCQTNFIWVICFLLSFFFWIGSIFYIASEADRNLPLMLPKLNNSWWCIIVIITTRGIAPLFYEIGLNLNRSRG